VANHLKTFEASPPDNKKLVFSLIQQAVKENPESLRHIFQEVIKLPKKEQDDLYDLLKRTTLTAVIATAKEVSNRLLFIEGIKDAVFGESRSTLKERSQLHRILATETWLFGEEYHLSVDDEGLRAVLEKHLEILRKPAKKDKKPVLLPDGRKWVVDLMLSRRVVHHLNRDIEHLVIELKRPKKKIDQGVLTQTFQYARAVAQDERFRTVEHVRWTFVAISTDFEDGAEALVNQKGRPAGVYWESDDGKILVKGMTWGQIFNDAESRLSFYKERLQYSPDIESARDHLIQTHGKYLPSSSIERSDNLEPTVPRPRQRKNPS